MGRFIIAVSQALANENWFGALFIALALPDICGALEKPDSRNRERYRDWFNRYLAPRYDPFAYGANDAVLPIRDKVKLTAQDCYLLRCACLHEGTLEREGGKKIVFTFPDDKGNTAHLNLNAHGDVLQLQVDIFCGDICNGVHQWMQDVAGNVEIQKRRAELADILPFY